ncbi:hypothetical protein [[Mycobacterium] burgundiense]|uniref:Arsenate reductase n=1 Tax=[Mycobacterium] burgundiense TaxID=3064286 RepID=A0ABM9LVF1_9MYCO|nr:hypothetical protein [Mycolicibacterium sp. MU0053]CAJ1505387.1 hypothetical protein MU0053_002923 [Mycolicibacterium sp. MU0053]
MAIKDVSGWVPQSCSLPSVERPLRVAEFDRLFGESVLRSTRLSSTRLDLALAGEAEPEAWELAARETGCCSFFRFGFESVGADVVMRIEVPHSHVQMLDALARRVDAMAGGEVR